MVELEINNHVFRINNGSVSSGSQHFADEVEALAESEGIGHPANGDPDYCIAERLVARHGGRITRHEYTAWRADVVY